VVCLFLCMDDYLVNKDTIEEYSLLGCNTMHSFESQPVLQRNM
jgi:hypothetical protein